MGSAYHPQRRRRCSQQAHSRSGALARWALGAQREAHALLFVYLLKCQACTVCNYIQHRMCCVTRHAQCVYFLPGTNSNPGGISGRTLFCEFPLSLAQPLIRGFGQSFSVSADDVTDRAGNRRSFIHKRCRGVDVHMIRLPVVLDWLVAQIGYEFPTRLLRRAGQAALGSMPATRGRSLRGQTG